MKDEYDALQLTCNSFEDKSKQLQKENDQFVSITHVHKRSIYSNRTVILMKVFIGIRI